MSTFDYEQKLRLRIEDPPRRKHMVYLGGAVLAGIMKVIYFGNVHFALPNILSCTLHLLSLKRFVPAPPYYKMTLK